MEETTKKRLIPRPHPNGTSLFVVWMEGGGGVPAELRGAYSSPAKAIKAINDYQHKEALREANKRPYIRRKKDGIEDKARD